MSKLTLIHACFGYGSKKVLHDINLETAAGEFLGIIGPNGSGKTTLLKGMAGLINACMGFVGFDGLNIIKYGRENLAKKIAFVPQNPVLPDLFTAMEIVLMGRTPHLGLLRYEGEKDIGIALDAMEITQTAHLARRRVNELSGGERQRVIIARALAQEAQVLLLDEPTANLDINYQAETLNFLQGLCQDKSYTVVAALHDLNLASQYCDRLIMLKDGQVWKQGTPADVIKGESIRVVFGADVQVYQHPLNGLPTAVVTSRAKKSE